MEETKLTPKQWVLVRDWDSQEWRLNIFSHYSEEWKYVCVASVWKQCIPYENNEHLLNTTDEPVKSYEPQDGDFVFSGYKDVHGEEACHWVAIVKRGNAESYEAYCGVAWENSIKLWTEPEWCDSQEYTRPATDEEREVLISFLHKNGKDWDAERKELIEYKEPYEPKPGDFFVLETHVRETKLIAICNRLDGFTLSYYAGTIGKDQREIHLYSYYRLGTRDTVRPATEDERHLLLTKLYEMGKYWNADSRQIMDLVWTPKPGEAFYYPLWDYSIGAFRETKTDWCDTLALWIREHRCRTEMECKEMCDKLNANIE